MEEISNCVETVEEGYFSVVIKKRHPWPKEKDLGKKKKNGAQRENA